MFRLLDTNHDGNLSASEMDRATIAFRTLDQNGDGMLSRQELRRAFAAGNRQPQGSHGHGRRKPRLARPTRSRKP